MRIHHGDSMNQQIPKGVKLTNIHEKFIYPDQRLPGLRDDVMVLI